MGVTAKDIQAQREMLDIGRELAEIRKEHAELVRLRDTFAAAALTGLLAAPTDKDRSMEYWARLAYESSDAMLLKRSRTNHDAAPAARAQVDAAGISRQGTGNTLTDAEREAVKAAARDYGDNDMDAGCWRIAYTLRGLLERTA